MDVSGEDYRTRPNVSRSDEVEQPATLRRVVVPRLDVHADPHLREQLLGVRVDLHGASHDRHVHRVAVGVFVHLRAVKHHAAAPRFRARTSLVVAVVVVLGTLGTPLGTLGTRPPPEHQPLEPLPLLVAEQRPVFCARVKPRVE